MHAWRCAVLALLLCPLGTAPAMAGLYNTAADPDETVMAGKAEEITRLLESLFKLRGIAADRVDFDYPLRKRYVLTADLARRGGTDALSLEEKINLSAVLIRRGRPQEALQLLVPLSRQHPDNPLVQSNLATAYHLSGELRSASDTMESALSPRSKVWPPTWGDLSEAQQKFLTAAGWNEGVYDLHRAAEKLYEKLLKLRRREALKKDKTAPEHPDALFADAKGEPVRFVSEAGTFEPGKVATATRRALYKTAEDRHAIDLVQQLLLWLPADQRLYWLLAELYNARGTPADVKAAALIFDDLVRNKYTPADVAERHEKLKAYVVALPDETTAGLSEMLRKTETAGKAAGPPIDVKSLLVAFGFGVIVGLFVVWQVREIRRRRQARQAAHSR